MVGFKQFLLEKTFRLGQDVDWIYNKYFKKFVEKIRTDEWDGKLPNVSIFSSFELKTQDAKKAHKINPIQIRLNGVAGKGNFYNPVDKYISLQINDNALSVLNTSDFNFKKASNNVGDMKLQWIDDISERRIKGTIYHELSHWIDDSLHNSHIRKMVKKSAQEHNKSVLLRGAKSTTSTYYEINAQIHAIKQMKRQTSSEIWDSWTWDELIHNSAALDTMMKLNKQSNDYIRWRKELLKRMNREKLLGKKMKYIN